MRVVNFTVNTNMTIFDILFLKDDVIYISEPYNHDRKVFDKDRTYLGTITDDYFKEYLAHKLT